MGKETLKLVPPKEIKFEDVILPMPSTVENWQRFVAKTYNLLHRSIYREMRLLQIAIDKLNDHNACMHTLDAMKAEAEKGDEK